MAKKPKTPQLPPQLPKLELPPLPDPMEQLKKFFSIGLLNVLIPNNEAITESETIFTFEFSDDIDFSARATSVVFTIDEKVVIKDAPRTITKLLTPVTGDLRRATTKLIFPESLAGAKLTIKYSFSNPLIRTSFLRSDIEVKRAGLAEIEKIYWAEQEHALWGAKLTEKREICKNEIGFLHIYTKGMFGHEVWVEIKGKGNSTTKSLDIGKKMMRDNVLSVPYPMSNLIATYKSKVPAFNGAKLTLTGHADKLQNMTSKTDSLNFLTLHCTVDEANPSQSTIGTDVKVNITTDEEAIAEHTKAECILQFRPRYIRTTVPPDDDDRYKGDYGFDWVRIGDTGPGTAPTINVPRQIPASTAGYHNDFDYEEYMGVHYHNAPYTNPDTGTTYPSTNQIEYNGNNRGHDFKKDKGANNSPTVYRPEYTYNPESYTAGTTPPNTFGDGRMYKKLKLRYRQLIFNWDPKNVATFSETYTPIMTIMNGKDADLVLHLDIKTEPKEIVFEFNNNSANTYLSLDKTNISTLPATMTAGAASVTDKTSHTLKITCNGEFDQEYTLFARAFKQDDPATGVIDTKGEICGMLRILPNGQMYQRKIKVTIFNVKTNLNGTDKFGISLVNLGKDRISELLKQALVVPHFDILPLDSTLDNDFKDHCCIQVNTALPNTGQAPGIQIGEYALDNNKTGAIVYELEKKRQAQYGHIHDNAIRFYFVNELMPAKNAGAWIDGASTTGFSVPSVPGFTICFGTMNNETAMHELGHTLGLQHPFDAYNYNTPFSHHYCTTDNVMDYTHNIGRFTRKSFFHWHWQILNTKIR